LQKLLVREKAGTDTKGIYLISSNPAEPEMFELKVHKPKDKQVWIQSIRSAVNECPEEEDNGYVTFSFEERQRQLETKKNNIREIVGTYHLIIEYSIASSQPVASYTAWGYQLFLN